MAKQAGQWRRVNRGKGHSYYDPSGALVSGVTTLLKGYPKPALVDWAARSVAEWAGDHKDDFADLTPSKVTKQALEAFRGGRQGAMAKGKTIHELAEYLMRGDEVEVDPSQENYVDQFLRWVADFEVSPIAAEVMIVSPSYTYCGTADLLCFLGDRLALIDYKTGSTGIWPETALQLAAYAWADSYVDPATDELRTMPLAPEEPPSKIKPEGTPRFDVVAALWLQDDRYELVPVDAGKRSFTTFRYVASVAQFMDVPRDEVVLEALAPRVAAK
jgi:hypothetical protein